MHHVHSPKFCITSVFGFSWHGATVIPRTNWKKWFCKIWVANRLHNGPSEMVNISEFFSHFSCRRSIKLPECLIFWLVENQVRLFVAACGPLSRWRHNASYYTETPCWGLCDGHQYGGRKPTKHLLLSFCTKGWISLSNTLYTLK